MSKLKVKIFETSPCLCWVLISSSLSHTTHNKQNSTHLWHTFTFRRYQPPSNVTAVVMNSCACLFSFLYLVGQSWFQRNPSFDIGDEDLLVIPVIRCSWKRNVIFHPLVFHLLCKLIRFESITALVSLHAVLIIFLRLHLLRASLSSSLALCLFPQRWVYSGIRLSGWPWPAVKLHQSRSAFNFQTVGTRARQTDAVTASEYEGFLHRWLIYASTANPLHILNALWACLLNLMWRSRKIEKQKMCE